MLPPSSLSLTQEALFFVTSGWAVYVSLSATLLFWIVHRRERQLQTPWRAIGFFLVSIAFACAIAALFYEQLFFISLILEVFGFAAIWYGVRQETILSHLRTVPSWFKSHPHHNAAVVLSTTAAVLTSAVSYVASAIFIGMTVVLQTQRYIKERSDKKAREHNIFPLLAYLFLLARNCFFILFLAFPFAVSMWYLAMASTIAAFIFLGIWAWIFIRVRRNLRTPIILLAFGSLAIVLATAATTTLFILLIRALVQGI